MSVFFTLVGKILPLYSNIIIGYVFGRFFKEKRQLFVFCLFYFITPFVFFCATLSIELNLGLALLPIWNFAFGSAIAFFVLYRYKRHYNDNTINILSFTSGIGNTGYFGIPIAMILFSPDVVSLYIFSVTATILYESTTGYYVVAKGSFTAKQSLRKILKLPIFYAVIFGLGLNVLDFSLPDFIIPFYTATKWLYGICGMMIIGMGLSGFEFKKDFDLRFIGIASFYKFLIWPISVVLIIFIDQHFLIFFNIDAYKVLFLYSIMPLAGNTVTLALLLNAQPQKASISVLFSTLISLVYIPLMIVFFDKVMV